MAKRITNEDFPHASLNPYDATPRITTEHAEEVISLIDESGHYPVTPAIIIAVWTEGLVKYLTDDYEVRETITNLRKAIEEERGRDNE